MRYKLMVRILGGFLILLAAGPLYADSPLTIVALGDSTTAGTPGFASPAENPPAGAGNPESQYTHWILQRHPEWTVLNRGVNGERSDQILNRFDRDVKPYQPRVVIVLAGVNDLYQGYNSSRVEKNLREIYERSLKMGIQVMACTILPFDEAGPDVTLHIQEVNRWIQTYATEQHLGFCDTYSAVEDPARPGKLLGSPDGLHPDVATYRKMGEAIASALEGMLK